MQIYFVTNYLVPKICYIIVCAYMYYVIIWWFPCQRDIPCIKGNLYGIIFCNISCQLFVLGPQLFANSTFILLLQALDKMETEWNPVNFEILPYKETGTFILKASEDISQLLDDHIVMTQSMSFSPFKKPFEERISTWESKLRTTQVGTA